MYFTKLPDHTAPGFDEQEHFRRFSRHNVVFNAFSRQIQCDDHVGCLSLKTILSGEEWYEVDGRHIAIRRGQCLILNDDQNYACHIDRADGAHVLSVFFQKDFAASVFRDILQSEETLLDNPQTPYTIPEFFQTLHAITPDLGARLSSLRTQLNAFGDDQNQTDEHLNFLLRYLLHTHRAETHLLSAVHSTKPGTKKEILRRLCIAKDILHSEYRESIDLARLSRQSFLSTPQLIRQFKSVFKKTPYQYLVAIRLRHAAEALTETDAAVQDIGWHSGFEDSSAFCRAFRTAYGHSPERYRLLNNPPLP
jgi:AraC family transcriptional regulator